uniref:Candidate secreted effector n=1 Tax=Meloidogyne incognita TaxID=6306 RepID=A0A914MCN1_MELIC
MEVVEHKLQAYHVKDDDDECGDGAAVVVVVVKVLEYNKLLIVVVDVADNVDVVAGVDNDDDDAKA